MKTRGIAVTVCLGLILCSCAHRPWTREEKVLAGMSVGAACADAYTTVRMLDNPDNYEANPILGKHPSKGRVILTLAGTEAAALALAHAAPRYRKAILGLKTMINLAGTALNLRLSW